LDFFVSTAALAARRGNPDARAVLAWMSNFMVGRFLTANPEFDPRDGIAYQLAIAPREPRGARPYQTWREIGAETRARGWSNGDIWRASDGYYGQLALQSLAQIVDIVGGDAPRRAYAWLLAAGAPWTRVPDLAREPTWSIVPRGGARVPARAPRCAPVSPAQR
jgi:hypothetical protein